jgi:hypothetical protein
MDPVHPLPLVYAKMAGGVIKMTNNLAENEHKRRWTDSLDGSGMRSSEAADVASGELEAVATAAVAEEEPGPGAAATAVTGTTSKMETSRHM